MPLMYAAAPFVDGADTADAPGTSATVVIESSARGQSRAAPSLATRSQSNQARGSEEKLCLSALEEPEPAARASETNIQQ